MAKRTKKQTAQIVVCVLYRMTKLPSPESSEVNRRAKLSGSVLLSQYNMARAAYDSRPGDYPYNPFEGV